MSHIEMVTRITDDCRLVTTTYDRPMHLAFGVDHTLVRVHRVRRKSVTA